MLNVRTCDPDGRLHLVVATPRLLGRHQAVPAEGQIVVVAGHQVPGDGAAGGTREEPQGDDKNMETPISIEQSSV